MPAVRGRDAEGRCAVILRVLTALAVWVLSLALLPVAAVMEARRKRRERKCEEARIAEQVRDFRRELQEWL